MLFLPESEIGGGITLGQEPASELFCKLPSLWNTSLSSWR